MTTVQQGGFANALGVADEQGGAVTNYTRGEPQEKKCRDPIFAVLLVIAVVAVVVVAAVAGSDATEEAMNGTESTGTTDTNYRGFIYVMLISGLCSFGFSAVLLPVMFRLGNILIKATLIVGIVAYFVIAGFMLVAGQVIPGIICLVLAMFYCCYAFCVWSSIPFATANLVTGMTSVRSNCGVTIVAYWLSATAIVWTLIWLVALAGVYDENQTNYPILFVFLLAYYFVHQVLKNVIHVTVAGVVGTWWLAPEEAKGCCSSAVKDSFFRSVTSSFGSICFGSFLLAVVQALKTLANIARNNGEDYQILLCLVECILGCIEDIIEYFNKWAFVYVGLYGYGYIEAGKNVITLFKNRGFESIVADQLVDNVLFMAAMIVGLLSGVVALLLETSNGDWFNNAPLEDEQLPVVVFIIGFVTGTALSSIIMNIISSSVNATIVLFMEAPAEFESNYPALSAQMREAWSGIN